MTHTGMIAGKRITLDTCLGVEEREKRGDREKTGLVSIPSLGITFQLQGDPFNPTRNTCGLAGTQAPHPQDVVSPDTRLHR
jgi:hypothetical protein